APFDRFDGFVGLLDEVLGERLVSLLGVPGAFASQGVHDLHQRDQPMALGSAVVLAHTPIVEAAAGAAAHAGGQRGSQPPARSAATTRATDSSSLSVDVSRTRSASSGGS